MPVPIDSWELRQGLALIFHSLSGFGSRGHWDKSTERGTHPEGAPFPQLQLFQVQNPRRFYFLMEFWAGF